MTLLIHNGWGNRCTRSLDVYRPLKSCLEGAARAVVVLAGDDRATERSRVLAMRRDGDTLAGHALEGRDHRVIEGRPALEEDVLAHAPVLDHAVEVVEHNRVGQAGGQIGGIHPRLLMLEQLRLHEHRAALPQVRRGLPGERRARKLLLDGDAELLRLLLEERAVPAAQTLFMVKSTTTVLSMLIYFESCPPISKIVSTVGSRWIAPRAWAVISLLDDIRADKVGDQVAPEPVGRATDVYNVADRSPARAAPRAPPRWALSRSSGIHCAATALYVHDHQVRGDRAHVNAQCGHTLAGRDFGPVNL